MVNFLRNTIPNWIFMIGIIFIIIGWSIYRAFKKEKMKDWVNERIDKELKSLKDKIYNLEQENSLLKEYLAITLLKTPDKFVKFVNKK